MTITPEVKPELSENKTANELTKKPRKLLSLSYKYSDSDEEETREERKVRIVSSFYDFELNIYF